MRPSITFRSLVVALSFFPFVLLSQSLVITGPGTVCNGSSITLYGNGIPPANQSPWSSSDATKATISNSGVVAGISPGTVTITYTDNGGVSTTKSVTVVGIPPLWGNFGIHGYCQSSGTTTLPYSSNPPDSAYEILYYDNNQSLLPGLTSLTVDLTTPINDTFYVSQRSSLNSSCIGPKMSVVTIVSETPAAPITQDLNYCQFDTPIPALTAQFGSVNLNGSSTLQWFNSSQSAIPSAPVPPTSIVNTNTWYVRQIDDVPIGQTCAGPKSSINVTTHLSPSTPTATQTNFTYCTDEVATQLSAIADPGHELIWYDALGNILLTAPIPNTTNSGPTKYYVSQKNSLAANCESNTIEFTITVLDKAATPVYNGVLPIEYCEGDPVTPISVSSSTPGLFKWFYSDGTITPGNGSAPSITTAPIDVGTYVYKVIRTPYNSALCESDTLSITIIIHPRPVVTTSSESICFGASVLLEAFGANTYTWTGGLASGNSTLASPQTTTTYTVTGTDVNQCQNFASATVTVLPLPSPPTSTYTNNSVTLCQGPGTFVPSVTNDGSSQLTWYESTGALTPNNGSAPIINKSSTGTYTYTVSQTDLNGCESDKIQITVIIVTLPPSPSTTNLSYCQGFSSPVWNLTPIGGTTLQWYDSDGVTQLTSPPSINTNVVGTTTYFVSHKTTNCESPLASISVSILAPPTPPTATPSSYVYCFEESADVLTASANANHVLTWYNGSTALSGAPTPSTSIAGNLTYSVTQTDPQGCESAKTDIPIIVHPEVDPPTASPANTYEYCQGDQTFTLNANTTSPVNNLVFYNSDGTKTAGNGAPPTPSSSNPGTTQYYVVQLSSSTGCESDPLNLDVDILALPTITTTAAIAACAGDAVTLNGAGAGINGTYNWTGGVTDGVSFVPAFSNTSITYTVTGTDINGCQNNATATVTVNDLPVSPVVNTTSYSYCKDAAALPLQANVAFNHALKWYDTDGTTLLSAPFTPPTNITGTFIYYVSQVSNLTDCESLPVAITVTVGLGIPKPITFDRILCKGDPSTQLTATLLPGNTPSWYGPNGLPLSFAPIYSTNTAGTTSYYVSQFDPVSQCLSQTDTIDVIVNPLPNVSAGADLTVCEGDSVTLVGSGAGASATYSWSGSITNGTTFIPSATSTYTVTGTDGNGCDGFDNMTVTVNPIPLIPNVDPSSPTTFITGSLSSVLSAIPLSGHSLIWYNSDGSLVNGDGTAPTPSTSVSNLGITNYFVSQINDVTGCESPTLNIQIIILGVGVSNDTLICQTDTAKLMVNTFGASGGSTSWTYLWSTGQTTSTINVNPTVDATYWIAISDGSNTWYDTVNVDVNNLNISITQTDTILCAGDSTGALGVAINQGYGPYQYLWNTSVTNDSLYNVNAGGYSVVVTDSVGCTAYDSITIVQPNVISLTTQGISNYNGFDISCSGEADAVAYANANGGTPGYTYLWSNGATGDTVTSLSSGTYFVTVIDSNGCSTLDTLILTEPSPLALNISSLSNVFGNQIDCYGDSTGVLFSALVGGVGGYSYTWNNGSTIDSIYNLGAGTYWVTAQDTNGCTLTDTVTLTQPSLPFTTTASTQSNFNGFGISCNGGNDGSISVSAQGSNAPYSYAWSNGVTSASQSNLVQGTYSVTVTDSLGCISNANVSVTEPSLLTYSYIIDDVSCYLGQNGSIEIIPQGGVMPYDIQWFNGTDSTVLDSLGSGFYTFTLTDQNNCLVIDSVEIYEPAELEITIDTIQPTCERIRDGEIDAFIYGGTYPYSYTLNGSQVNLPHDSVAIGNYVLTVVDSNSCTQTISFNMNPLQPSCFMIPNMYSPNYDGYNDVFTISHSSWSSYTLNIYNSIGQLVYSGSSSTPYWDGITSGNPMPTGDYYYQLITNEGEVIYGYVTLIR
jgi:gliding motility-associated-like protein